MIKTGHGGDIYTRDIEYDFSANINPLGMPQSVKTAIVGSIDAYEKYPDVNCTELKNAIAELENIDARNIVCGSGAADLIYKIVQVTAPKKALIIAPTFSEYEKALRSFGCEIEYFYLEEKNDFELSENIADRISGMDLMFLCNPNNPVGNIVNHALLQFIIDKCVANKTVIVVDECFMDFVEDSRKYSVKADYDNVIILKAFTKIYAMPGLRLGYLICKDESLCEKIENIGQCWSVSTVAQTAGAAALAEKKYIEKTVSYVKKERDFLTANLKKFGFKVYPSKANFIFFRTNFPIDKMLLNEKIAVRNCGNYVNLNENFFRIAVRTHKENEILINTLERILNNGKG